VEPGTYQAQAVTQYDGKILLLEKSFDVGEPLIDITRVQAGPFHLGTIAKFDISLLNNWNQELKGVYGETKIWDSNGVAVNNYKTSVIDIPGSATKDIAAYWDTAGVNAGKFMISIRANYLGRSREKNFNLDVQQDQIKVSSLTGDVIGAGDAGPKPDMLFYIVPALAVVVIALYFFIKKRKDALKKKQHAESGDFLKSQPAIPVGGQKIPTDLKEYITFNLKQGISVSAIKGKLLEKGYDEKFIDSIILDSEDDAKK
jgi:hypothetical protein